MYRRRKQISGYLGEAGGQELEEETSKGQEESPGGWRGSLS